jgi:hypothetical protein
VKLSHGYAEVYALASGYSPRPLLKGTEKPQVPARSRVLPLPTAVARRGPELQIRTRTVSRPGKGDDSSYEAMPRANTNAEFVSRLGTAQLDLWA